MELGHTKNASKRADLRTKKHISGIHQRNHHMLNKFSKPTTSREDLYRRRPHSTRFIGATDRDRRACDIYIYIYIFIYLYIYMFISSVETRIFMMLLCRAADVLALLVLLLHCTGCCFRSGCPSCARCCCSCSAWCCCSFAGVRDTCRCCSCCIWSPSNRLEARTQTFNMCASVLRCSKVERPSWCDHEAKLDPDGIRSLPFICCCQVHHIQTCNSWVEIQRFLTLTGWLHLCFGTYTKTL